MFILAGNAMNAATISERIWAAADAAIGRLRAGLGHVTVLMNVVISSMSGSAVSDAAGAGMVAIQMMRKVAISPAVWGEQGDASLVARTLETDIPQVLDYLEDQLPKDGFLFGALSIADISIAAFFRNASFARFTIDATRWPRTATFVDRVLATPPFQRLAKLEDRLIRTPIPQHRPVLTDLGVRLTADTLAVSAPRRGVMPI
jgi:hypothetical protein